jgi:ATP-dependent exoDNAse (exonuclease V) alpha subunit
MAIFHCQTKPLSRSSGRSAVAAIAYRSGSLMRDERQGLTHDYTRRSGVEYEELVLPEGAGQWTRESLWNAAEMAEKRKDARTAREWEVALPSELTPEERRGLAVEFAQALSVRYGCAVDVAVHAPSAKGDQRNFHAHLMATTRAVRDGVLGEKVAIELDDKIRAQRGMEPGRREIEQVRALWAETSNRRLERAGEKERIDHRSLAAQKEEALTAGDIIRSAELDRAPQTKLGWKASAMERRGVETERGQQLREVKRENMERRGILERLHTLKESIQNLWAKVVGPSPKREGDRFEEIAEKFKGMGAYATMAQLGQMESAARAEPRAARQIFESDGRNKDAVELRELQQLEQRNQGRATQLEWMMKEYRIKHPLQSALGPAPFVGRELKGLESEWKQAQQVRQDIAGKIGEIEKRWAKVHRPAYEAQAKQERVAIQEAQGRWNQVKGFTDRLLARAKEHDAARSKERQAKMRGKERDRGIER